MAEQILGEAFAAFGVVGGDGFFAAVVDVEAGMFPGEEVGEFFRADVFAFAQGVEEAVAEEFDGGGEVFGRHAVEAAVGGEESVGGGDPVGGLADTALMAGGAQVAALAGEGEEAFVAAVGAMEAEEAGGEVAAAEEVADGGEDVGAERTEVGTVELFVAGEEGVPGGSEDLPEWRDPGAAGLVNEWHKECS